MDTLALKKMANEVRKGIVTAVHSAKSGHPGGSLSAADILTYLYFEEMNIDPKDPKKADRDRFVLSKGHIAPALYSTLAHRGYFPVEDLTTLRHVGSYLRVLICPVDLWVRAAPRQLEWHWPASLIMHLTAYIVYSEMARCRKVRYGKLRCLQVPES